MLIHFKTRAVPVHALEYYIDSTKIYKSSSSNKKSSVISTGISGYTLESNNILKNGSIVYFRKGGNARNFSIKAADIQTATSTSDGTISFSDAVAGDAQNVTSQILFSPHPPPHSDNPSKEDSLWDSKRFVCMGSA